MGNPTRAQLTKKWWSTYPVWIERPYIAAERLQGGQIGPEVRGGRPIDLTEQNEQACLIKRGTHPCPPRAHGATRLCSTIYGIVVIQHVHIFYTMK